MLTCRVAGIARISSQSYELKGRSRGIEFSDNKAANPIEFRRLLVALDYFDHDVPEVRGARLDIKARRSHTQVTTIVWASLTPSSSVDRLRPSDVRSPPDPSFTE